MNYWPFALITLGIWLIIDGVYSIIEYWKQTPQEHLIRVIRAIVGMAIIVGGYVWYVG